MWKSTLIGTAIALAFAVTSVQAQQQQRAALSCTASDIARVEASTAKITNPTQKTAATKEIALAKEMMAKNDDTKCVTHLENAAKMAPM